MAWRNKKKDKFVQQNSGRSDWSEDVKDENKTDLRLIETQAVEAIDAKYGFERINKGCQTDTESSREPWGQ